MPEAPERPPIASAPLGVVLPAYNVEADLERILEGWRAFLDTLERAYEICIVNDGSTDRTGDAAEALAVQFPQIRVLHHSKESGIGAALRTGLEVSRLPLFCYAECSTAYQPADLTKMLELIDQVDLVCGYREWKTRPERWHWKERLYGLMARLVFGVRLKDVDCPFKLFRREIFSRIPIQSDGSFAHAEVVAKANFLGCLIAEVPVSFQSPGVSARTVREQQERLTEAYRVFRNPSFGPAMLSENVTSPLGANYNRNQVKALFYVPLKDNDGRDLRPDIDDLRMELYAHFVGWTSLGMVKGAYLLADGTQALDESEAFVVIIHPSRLGELEGVLRDFRSKTLQEAIYLEIQRDVEVRLI